MKRWSEMALVADRREGHFGYAVEPTRSVLAAFRDNWIRLRLHTLWRRSITERPDAETLARSCGALAPTTRYASVAD